MTFLPLVFKHLVRKADANALISLQERPTLPVPRFRSISRTSFKVSIGLDREVVSFLKILKIVCDSDIIIVEAAAFILVEDFVRLIFLLIALLSLLDVVAARSIFRSSDGRSIPCSANQDVLEAIPFKLNAIEGR